LFFTRALFIIEEKNQNFIKKIDFYYKVLRLCADIIIKKQNSKQNAYKI